METTAVNGSNPVLDILAQQEAASRAEDFATDSLGREDFLMLLIAQLENQDPMQPAKDTEFVAQLATFSSLEQQIATNDNLELLALGQVNLINAQALNLIGKEALVESNGEIRLEGGSAERIVYALPRPASSATLTIYDNNTPIRVLELETTPSGRVALDWDGLDSDGNAVADGNYRFEVHAMTAEGEAMSVAVFKALPIDGVTFGETGIGLVSGDQEVLFEAILEIRTGQSNG